MIDEYKDRIENAKNRPLEGVRRFSVGDVVYPFWLRSYGLYGTVTDVSEATRKITCDFAGRTRQFDPDDLVVFEKSEHGAGKKTASVNKPEYKYYVVLPDGKIESGWEYREDANDRKSELSDDGIKSKVLSGRSVDADDDSCWHSGGFGKFTAESDGDNGIRARCRDCGGDVAVSFDERTAMSDFVCTRCGKRISESRLPKGLKQAMKDSQRRSLMSDIAMRVASSVE